ncbi:MAG: prenyltransferase/squalene oxidase repeat-containing protein [Candidatus Thorarchaeota archaeon]
MRKTGFIICLLVVTSACSVSFLLDSPDNLILPSQKIITQTTTRRDAIIDYIEALYIPNEGAFYGYLNGWPTDPRIGSYHTIANVYKPVSTLNYLDALMSFDMTNCSEFAKGLMNTQENIDYMGPVNFSANSMASVISLSAAVDLFSFLDIYDLIIPNHFSNLVVDAQRPNGGFVRASWDTSDENLIFTQSALYAMQFLGLLDRIDTSAALSYVLACYSDGEFAYGLIDEPDYSSIPLGLMCLDYLDALDSIDRASVIANVLTHWDNSTGNVPDGTIADAEIVIWSLYLLDALDRIDIEAAVDWVLARQSNINGAILPYHGANQEDERFEWCRAGVHILEMLDRLDALDEEFSVFITPVHTIPQGYYDFIAEYVDTTETTSDFIPYFVFPEIDFLGIILTIGPPVLVVTLLLTPVAYLYRNDRNRRKRNLEMKKKRKPGRKW